MKTIPILILCLAFSAYPASNSQDGLSLVLYDDVRSAPVGFPLYISFSLRNETGSPMDLPFQYGENLKVHIHDSHGRALKGCATPATDLPGAPFLRIGPHLEHFQSLKLNHAHGFPLLEGAYTLRIEFMASGESEAKRSGDRGGEPPITWRGRLTSGEVYLRVTAPPSQEDAEAYALIKRFGPFPEATLYPAADELFSKFPESIYSAYALISGVFAKTDAHPTANGLIALLKKKYGNSYAEQLLIEKEAALAFNRNDLESCLTAIKTLNNKWPESGVAVRNSRLLPDILRCKEAADRCKGKLYDTLSPAP